MRRGLQNKEKKESFLEVMCYRTRKESLLEKITDDRKDKTKRIKLIYYSHPSISILISCPCLFLPS